MTKALTQLLSFLRGDNRCSSGLVYYGRNFLSPYTYIREVDLPPTRVPFSTPSGTQKTGKGGVPATARDLHVTYNNNATSTLWLVSALSVFCQLLQIISRKLLIIKYYASNRKGPIIPFQVGGWCLVAV